MNRSARRFAFPKIAAAALALAALAPPAHASTAAQNAAAALTQILGTPVAASDLRVLPVRRTIGLPTSIGYVRDALLQPGSTYLEVRVREPRFTAAVFKVRPALRDLLLDASFVLAIGDASEMVAGRTCTVKLCGAGGACEPLTVTILYGTCPPDVCTSAADCGGFGGVECQVRNCDPWGHCTLSLVSVPAGQPCPPSGCSDDSSCPTTASTKQCTYKRCSSFSGKCESTTIEVDADAPCPPDECTSDSQCGGGGGDGGIFEDILETQARVSEGAGPGHDGEVSSLRNRLS